jgi:hypothetical protein
MSFDRCLLSSTLTVERCQRTTIGDVTGGDLIDPAQQL